MDFRQNNVTTVQQLMDLMKNNLQYGFTSAGKTYREGADFGQQMAQHYQLKTEEDLIKSGYGVCWDFCELERCFCEQMQIPHACYFFLSFLQPNQGGPTHTFLLFEQNKKWYWFEYAWQAYQGIWEYPSQQAALDDIKQKFCQASAEPFTDVQVYKTEKAQAGLNFFEFLDHCLQGERITMPATAAMNRVAADTTASPEPELAR